MQKDWETQKEIEENDKEQNEKEMKYCKLSRYGIHKISYTCTTFAHNRFFKVHKYLQLLGCVIEERGKGLSCDK